MPEPLPGEERTNAVAVFARWATDKGLGETTGVYPNLMDIRFALRDMIKCLEQHGLLAFRLVRLYTQEVPVMDLDGDGKPDTPLWMLAGKTQRINEHLFRITGDFG